MTEASNMRFARLLTLVPWLTAHSGVSKEAAAKHFGLSVAQLDADLELITFTGPGLYGGDLVDIHFDDETITVYDSQGLDRPLRLSGDEVSALLLGLLALQQLPDTDAVAVAGCIEKLSHAGESTADIAITLQPDETSHVVAEAIRTGHTLQIQYLHPLRDDATDRTITPSRMFSADGADYVEGWCHAVEANRTFRLDRMLKCEIGAQSFDRPTSQNTKSERRTAVVEVEPWAQHLLEGIPASIVSSQNGATANIEFVDDRWLELWAVSAGAGVHVRAPEGVQRRARQRAEAALVTYGHIPAR